MPSVGLRFCKELFSSKSCCVSGFDSTIQGFYQQLLLTSQSCFDQQGPNQIALRYWFCFGCNPDQPKYLIDVTPPPTNVSFENCTVSRSISCSNSSNGNCTKNSTTNCSSSNCTEAFQKTCTNITAIEIPQTKKYEIRICAWLANLMHPESFDCSLNLPANRYLPCLGGNPAVSYLQYGYGLNGTLNFLNDDTAGKPPFFENTPTTTYTVVVR